MEGKEIMERLLTILEVSEMLGKGKKKSRFVYELARKRIIPCAKIGGQFLFKTSDVEDYIDTQFSRQN